MTAPYVTGTVSVTAGSAVVTGNGTGWQTGLVIGGLFGLDSANGNPVPILSIDSDTQLTLAKPWRGTTAANQAQWIVRDTAYGQQTVANAQALATYIQRLDNQSLASIAGLVPAADRLPYFTGANSAALTTLSAFSRTLLDDSNAAAAYATLGEVPDAQIPTRLRTQAIVEAELNAIAYNGWWRNGGTGADNPGVGYGNGYGYGYDDYYDPYYGGGYYGANYNRYGYGYGQPYYGWYNGYYYPGTGYYVYDRDRRAHRRMSDARRWSPRIHRTRE